MLADNTVRVAIRARVITVFNGLYILKAFPPNLAASRASDRTYVLSEIPAFNVNRFTVDETVRDFFSCRKENPLKGGAGHTHFLGAFALFQAFQIFEANGLEFFEL